uniref:Uncharacterized protein n=1 Tax=mine drainage metagenome TaxID=410659 RepID=E6QS89_9ZZZZ
MQNDDFFSRAHNFSFNILILGLEQAQAWPERR